MADSKPTPLMEELYRQIYYQISIMEFQREYFAASGIPVRFFWPEFRPAPIPQDEKVEFI